MKNILPKNLIALAQKLPTPLYVVGGSVRDFVAGFRPEVYDFDLAAAIRFMKQKKEQGYTATFPERTTNNNFIVYTWRIEK